MENATESLIITFAVIVFVIALSLTMYMLSKSVTTTKSIVAYADKTNFMPNIEIAEGTSEKRRTSREVTMDTVITSLYRYYKENFMVKIYNNSELVQVFDTTIESKVNAALPADQVLLNKYGSGKLNMFGAPWMGDVFENAKYRVDLYLSNQKGYIKDTMVDYTENGIKAARKKSDGSLANTCVETFIEYMYSGQSIQTSDRLESLTGNAKEKDKIVIEYRFN